MMTSSTKIRSQRFADYLEIKVLIRHPMENGRNRDSEGKLIPAHFIQTLSLELNGQTLMLAHLGPSLSRDPYFCFRLQRVESGALVKVSWSDNQGLSDAVQHKIEISGE